MKNLETQIEKIYKEYIEYKTLLTQKIEQTEQEVGREFLEDYTHEKFFDKVSYLSVAEVDLAELRMRLYFTMDAYKDLVEPPTEIKEAIEAELEGVKMNQTFTVKNGEFIIINQERYDLIKENYYNKIKKQIV
jgi:hypothetical protein